MVAPFAIEADHPRMATLLLQSVPNCRLRSRISASKGTIVNTADPDNMPVIPLDQARALGQLPVIPGMQFHCNPGKLSYMVYDPLSDDEDMCERIRKVIQGPSRTGEKMKGMKTEKGTLDVDRMKTLVRELVRLVDAGDAKVIKGMLPVAEDIDGLPGDFLLNPGSMVPNSQPRLEKDWDEWVKNLSRYGG